jgi:2-polyprenyl-3-methyl-5-hydroxy-6-metoxy-1,4-benzoquinol methylase
MEDVQEIDVEQIMEWLREDIKKRRQQHSPENKTSRFPDEELAADFASLHATYDVYNLQFTSHRRILGPLVIFVKKILRQLLTPILTHQVTYNAVNTRVATRLGEKLAALNHQAQMHEGFLTSEGQAMQAVQAQLAAFEQRMRLREDMLTAHAEAMQAVQAQLAAFEQRMRLREDMLTAHAEAMQAVQAQLTAFEQRMRQRDDMLTAHAEAMQAVQAQLTAHAEAMQAGQAQLTAFEQRMRQRDDMLTAHAEAMQAVQAQLTAHAEAIQAGQAQLTAFEQRMRQRDDMLTAHAEAMQEHLDERIENLDQQQKIGLQSMRERVSKAERKLRRVLYVLTDDQKAGERLKIERQAMPSQALEPNFDYFGFEEKFRGSAEDIKARQRAYVEYFQGQNDILDIGCGRGEFLELLREAGIKVKGVDLDLDMVLYCREKGLNVIQEDGFAYLDSLPDEALGGVFAAQVIEHLESKQIIELVKLCQRKLRPGGILILETLNPKCLMIFAESFYMDFSHIKPIHPEAMKFLLESTGFLNIELKFSAPVEPSKRLLAFPDLEAFGTTLKTFNHSLEQLNELLYGFQDYAVIGRKAPW